MDELEDSLKRLFQDSRLDMRVAPEAEKTVVRGARRVRRRRIAMISSAGVLSLAVVAGGTFLLARPAPQSNEVATQPTASSDLPITTTSPTTQSLPTAPPAPRSAESVPVSTTKGEATPATSRPAAELPAAPTARTMLGPTGFGNFRLGMTESQLGATRQAQGDITQAPSSCVTYRIQSMPDTSTLIVSKRYGLVAISLTADATTPQRISIGSAEAEVGAAYRATPATVPENANAEYRFRYTAGKVTAITLAAKQSDCPA